jgi:hypothetical protein
MIREEERAVDDPWARQVTQVNGQMGQSGSAQVRPVKEELISKNCLTFFNQHSMEIKLKELARGLRSSWA